MIEHSIIFVANRAITLLPVIICTYYIYLTSIKINKQKSTAIFVLLLSIGIVSLTISLELIFDTYLKLLFIIFICLSSLAIKMKINSFNIPLMIISYGISFGLQIVCGIITGIYLHLFNLNILGIVPSALIAIMTIILTVLFIKPKRIKNGLRFFANKNNTGIGVAISSFIIVVCCIGGQDYIDDYAFTVATFGICLCVLGLYLWIRKSITEHYRKKLQAKAEEHYNETLAEKDEYIEQLSNSNAYLSKVVHRDNHLMSSLQYSIEQYKNCDDENEKQKILNEILTLTSERGDLLLKEQKTNKLLASTGSGIIDGALGNMYVKATAHNIDFNLVVNDEVHYLINNIITQTDLETLLCDHIKDAIIAIESDNSISGKILVTIGMVENIYEISIRDNGVDFDIDTLAKLGLERITTHKDNGGSGIGFMTTFETLKKTEGSLIITEFENKVPFSKSITFRFDGLNKFIIKSYRSDELKENIHRDDVIIL